MSQRLRDLKNRIEKLRNKVENLKPSDNLSQSQDEVEEIDRDIQNTEETIKEIEEEAEDDEELSSQKPLMDKFNEYKNDFEIIKNKYNKKRDEVMTAHNQELLMQGKLHGVEKKKAERDMALDQMKQIDEHDLIIDGIQNNIKGANNNLANMNVELKKQGEQINTIGEKVIQMDQTVKKTGEVYDGMEKRIFCRKFMMWLGIVILLLANIVIAFLIIARGAGWPPFRDSKGNNGLDIIQSEEINFEDAYNRNYTMIMIEAGNNTMGFNRLREVIKALRDKKLEAGIYWTINIESEISDDQARKNKALDQARKAIEKVKEAKDEGLDYGFYFKFGENSSDLMKKSEIVSDLCDIITKEVSIDCGLALPYQNYKDYYKGNVDNLDKIKRYWIDSPVQDTDVKDESKVRIWRINGDREYEKFNKLRYK